MDLDGWCRAHLGAGLATVRWSREGTGIVWGVDLEDGRSAVVKAHRRGYVPDEHLAAMIEVQHRVAEVRDWAPRPLAGPAPLGDRIATAEELLEDGEPAPGPVVMAAVLRDLVTQAGAPPAGLFRLWSFSTLWAPPHQEDIDLEAPGGEWIDAIAVDARTRMAPGAALPHVVGHVDWRCEHVLVEPGTDEVRAVHDWDSLTAGPEAWLAGAASVCFTVDFNSRDGSPARWPTPEECAAFLEAYDPHGRLDGDQVRAAGDYHLAYIARCVLSVGGFDQVLTLLDDRCGGAR